MADSAVSQRTVRCDRGYGCHCCSKGVICLEKSVKDAHCVIMDNKTYVIKKEAARKHWGITVELKRQCLRWSHTIARYLIVRSRVKRRNKLITATSEAKAWLCVLPTCCNPSGLFSGTVRDHRNHMCTSLSAQRAAGLNYSFPYSHWAWLEPKWYSF